MADWRSRIHLSTPSPRSKPITVRTFLTAIIKSYEIQGIYQERNAFNEYGLDHTLLTKLAATASLSLILDLDHAQTCATVSQVWTDSSPLRLFRQSPNTGPRKGWAAGDACMRAVHLALLTQEGQAGYPTALTDPEWGFLRHHYGSRPLLTRPFGTSVIDGRFVKLVAAEGHGISAVEAALTLGNKLGEMGITDPAETIAKIEIRTMKSAMQIIDKIGPLRNAADRDHCMRYMVALTLIKGDWPQAGDYEDGSPYATSADVETLRSRIDMVEDLQLTADYHDRSRRTGASGLTVTLKDGRVLEEVLVEYPIGHPWHKGTEKALREKTRTNLRLGFTDDEVEGIMVVAEGEEFLDNDVAGFVDLFWKGDLGAVNGEALQVRQKLGLLGTEGALDEVGGEKGKQGGIWEWCVVM